MFPGQGAQEVGMGADVRDGFDSARAVFDAGDQAAGFALSRVVLDGPDEELTRTVNAQPGLLMVELALLAAAREVAGPDLPLPAFVAGHSLGEYAALVAAGVCDIATAIALAHRRGELMQQASDRNPGTMAAVIGLDDDQVAEVCRQTEVSVANLNCPGQVAIAGSVPGVAAARRLAREHGAKLAIPLDVSGAFHSPLMEPAVAGMREAVAAARLGAPRVPLVANTTATVLSSADEVRDELVAQVTGCVRWAQTVRLMVEAGVDTFMEFGPGTVLAGLASRIAPQTRTITVSDAASVRDLAGALGAAGDRG
ncbi:MAG: ACP S-malonyltransferase [Propionicimonas sp.]|nr:ACP S-malonyltransferase [Propionicimonas sp.]